jgi:hypothetical protein
MFLRCDLLASTPTLRIAVSVKRDFSHKMEPTDSLEHLSLAELHAFRQNRTRSMRSFVPELRRLPEPGCVSWIRVSAIHFVHSMVECVAILARIRPLQPNGLIN